MLFLVVYPVVTQLWRRRLWACPDEDNAVVLGVAYAADEASVRGYAVFLWNPFVVSAPVELEVVTHRFHRENI